MPRLFLTDSELVLDSVIELNAKQSHHLLEVTRAKKGETVNLSDGKGGFARGEILSGGEHARVLICQVETKPPPALKIHVYQSCLSSSRMDLVIQKLTELGVEKITPLLTDQTVVDFKNQKKTESKLERWRKISAEAIKQSKRFFEVEISAPQKLSEFLKSEESKQGFFYLNEFEGAPPASSFSKADAPEGGIRVLMGPEAGWSKGELSELQNSPGVALSLGEAILRAETASIGFVAWAMIQLGLD